MSRPAPLLIAALSLAGTAAAQAPSAYQAGARAIFKGLIEINTTHSTGSTTVAAAALRKRFLAAGFPAADVEVVGPAGSNEPRVSPPSPLSGEFARAAEAVTTAMWPGVPAIPYMETGGTDGKFLIREISAGAPRP